MQARTDGPFGPDLPTPTQVDPRRRETIIDHARPYVYQSATLLTSLEHVLVRERRKPRIVFALVVRQPLKVGFGVASGPWPSDAPVPTRGALVLVREARSRRRAARGHEGIPRLREPDETRRTYHQGLSLNSREALFHPSGASLSQGLGLGERLSPPLKRRATEKRESFQAGPRRFDRVKRVL